MGVIVHLVHVWFCFVISVIQSSQRNPMSPYHINLFEAPSHMPYLSIRDKGKSLAFVMTDAKHLSQIDLYVWQYEIEQGLDAALR